MREKGAISNEQRGMKCWQTRFHLKIEIEVVIEIDVENSDVEQRNMTNTSRRLFSNIQYHNLKI